MQTLNSSFIESLREILPDQYIIESEEGKLQYASDHTEDLKFMPSAVVKPNTADQISKIMKLANEYLVPVTPRGGGTGVSGGALPIEAGLVISMERFNKILEVDQVNRCATVESGVITQVFQEYVRESGLFFPPDPGSKGSCMLGGNLAENSGGPRSLKYGVTRDYVLNLEVVLPDGEVIWTGKNVTKNATGYDLTQLLCGSEGTLGIITKIVFRLIDVPNNELLVLIPFKDNSSCFDAIHSIVQLGIRPVSMEFVDQTSLEVIEKFYQWSGLHESAKCYLWMELDGDTMDVTFDKCAKIGNLVVSHGGFEPLVAESDKEKEHLWTLRHKVGESIISYTVFKDIDTVVPVSKVGDLLQRLEEIEQQFRFKAACFGHIGNGNLHIQFLKEELSDEYWKNEIPKAVGSLFECVRDLGGSLSGEHGVGIVQKPFMPLIVPKASINLMKQIKQVFDPNNILNPGKIF